MLRVAELRAECAFEGCVSGAGSARPCPPRAQEALGMTGEVGMARETRALPGGGSGLEPLAEIRAKRLAGLVGKVSHRPFPGLPSPGGLHPVGRRVGGPGLLIAFVWICPDL